MKVKFAVSIQILLGLMLPVCSMAKSVPANSSANTLLVAKDGSGQFTSIQSAINAVPSNGSTAVTIYVKNGFYNEAVSVPANKPFIHLLGESSGGTIVTHNEYSEKFEENGESAIGTGLPTLSIYATDFSASNISFANTAGNEGIGMAVLVNNDRAAFKTCRILGNQGTLCINGQMNHKAYLRSCYIDGVNNLVFGTSIAMFDSCTLFVKAKKGFGKNSLVTANTDPLQPFGFVFNNCTITGNAPIASSYLSVIKANQTGCKLAFIHTHLSRIISQEGWLVESLNNPSHYEITEVASKNEAGTAVNESRRNGAGVVYSHDVAKFSLAKLFGNWEPCTAAPGFCAPDPLPLAIGNLEAQVGNANMIQLKWNMSWPVSNSHFEIYRAFEDRPFIKIGDLNTDEQPRLQFSDVAGEAGVYHYFIQVSKAGLPTQSSEILSIERN